MTEGISGTAYQLYQQPDPLRDEPEEHSWDREIDRLHGQDEHGEGTPPLENGRETMSEKRLTVEQEAALVLEEMARLKSEKLDATAEEREEVRQLSARIEAWEGKMMAINLERDSALGLLEQRAKELGLRAEGTIKTQHGSINFRKGYAKVTYDAKQLDAVAKMPAHEWILAYRSMAEVAPSVTVILTKISE